VTAAPSINLTTESLIGGLIAIIRSVIFRSIRLTSLLCTIDDTTLLMILPFDWCWSYNLWSHINFLSLLPSKRVWLTLILHQSLSYHVLLSNHVAGHIFTSIKGEHAYELLHYMHECAIITVLYQEYMLITVLNTYQCTIVTVNIDCGCRCWCRSSHRDTERFLRGIEEDVVRWFK
jgi:hypothetical protein